MYTNVQIVPVTTTGATLPAAPVVQVSEPLVARIVDEAPAAELANGDADISTTGQSCCMLCHLTKARRERRICVRLSCSCATKYGSAVTGACTAAYDIFCNTVKVGEGRFAECLTEQLHQEQLGNRPGDAQRICSHRHQLAGLAWTDMFCRGVILRTVIFTDSKLADLTSACGQVSTSVRHA